MASDKFVYKLAWLDRLRAELLADGHLPDGDVAVCGDMNVALDELRCGTRSEWPRVHLVGLPHAGLPEVHGLRIDHLFLSRTLMAKTREITAWRPVRKYEKPSDHNPVSVRID